jgi:transcriptional regulator with XRE-family HTH domain
MRQRIHIDPFPEWTADALRRARAYSNQTVEQIAKACGISPKTIYNYERGEGRSTRKLGALVSFYEEAGISPTGPPANTTDRTG